MDLQKGQIVKPVRVVFYVNIVSPHLLPMARAISSKVGEANFRYVYCEPLHDERLRMGWSANPKDIICIEEKSEEAQDWLSNANVMFLGVRAFDLVEKRSKKALLTYYMSERWFKPVRIPWLPGNLRNRIQIPGEIRCVVPWYCRLVRQLVSLCHAYKCFHLLPIGLHAQDDFLIMGVPPLSMTLWGYFVSPSVCTEQSERFVNRQMRVLWVGRLLDWKRVDTIVKAVINLDDISLTIVGEGQMLKTIKALAGKDNKVTFMASQPMSEIRRQMREHDVYVLSSDEGEGWGAALNEALQEGMICLGTYEAGASRTVLPRHCLFHAGDTRALMALLNLVRANPSMFRVHDWSVESMVSDLASTWDV